MSDADVPVRIEQAGPAELRIAWADGHVSLYGVALLRRACPCAQCVDEWTGERLLEPESVPEDVRPRTVEPVGHYAIRIEWSDGHASGIYSFGHLRRVCPCAACRGSA